LPYGRDIPDDGGRPKRPKAGVTKGGEIRGGVITFPGPHLFRLPGALVLQISGAPPGFAAARQYGKLANICADLPGEQMSGSAVFKSITGGDRITAEFKYRDSFEFQPFSRLLVSANHLPTSHDASKAFFDRWLIIPFDRSFR
jgi:hypothetical protein